MLRGDGQAANPGNALQAQIGQLRRTFGAAAIVTSDVGCALDVQPDQVDLVRFEQLVAKGRRLAAGGELASANLAEALGLRRGEPLAGPMCTIVQLSRRPRLRVFAHVWLGRAG